MPDAWQPPDGYTLTVVPEHYLDARGHGSDTRPAEPMPDGQIMVPWFGRALVPDPDVSEDEAAKRAELGVVTPLVEVDVAPWALTPNDGRGPNATAETRAAAIAGTPVMGWNPVILEKPIKDGYVPPQYVLVKDDDPTLGTVEPASATEAAPPSPEVEAQMLRDSIAAQQKRLEEIEGGGS